MADKPSGLKQPSRIAKGIPKPSGIRPPTAASSTGGAGSVGSSFNVGDRVIVSGTKFGSIQFLGPTQFAPGDWAGIVLDKEDGKNDGTVAGVKYFECKPMHGIFARPAKLVKQNSNGAASKSSTASSSRPGSGEPMKTAPLTVAALKAREGPKDIKPKSSVRSPTSSIRSLRYGTPSRPPVGPVTQDFAIGDKVTVNGVKIGYARYVGETDFAKGTWVGVELDVPQGKNDGSVMGKKYFECEMLFGLFAPLHKVKKFQAPRTATKGLMRETAASAAKKKAITGVRSPGSSVASVSSVSSFTGAKAKGIKSEVSSRYQRKTATGGTSALQEALKEKQQHVESLMEERDMERAETMQAMQDASLTKRELEELGIRYQELVVEKETQLDALKELVERADLEKVTIRQELDEQKTKVEDYQFRLEEEAINKEDLQSEVKISKEKVRELDSSLSIERNRSQALQRDLENTRASGVDDKSTLEDFYHERDSANDIVAELRIKLNEAEIALKRQAKSTGDIDAFEDRISELMQELEKKKINSEEDTKSIESFKLQLEEISNEKTKLESVISDLNTVKEKASEERDSSQFRIDEMKLDSEEKDRNLQSAVKQLEQLKVEKETLEQSKEEILRTSGDSSAQLIALNDSLKGKDRTIEQVNTELRITLSSLEETKSSQASLSNSKSSLDEEVSNLKNKLTETLKIQEELQNRIRDYEEESKTLSSKLEQASRLNQEASTDLKNINEEKTTIESRLEDLMQKCTQLQDTLHGVQQERTFIEDENKLVSCSLSEAESSLKSLQDKFNEQETEKEYLTKKCETMQNKVIELSEEHENLKITHKEAKSTLSQMQEQSGEKTQNLLQQMQEQREANEKQRSMVAESTKHMNEMLQQKIALEEIDKEHRSKILILEADTVNHKEEYRSLVEQYKSLKEIHEKIESKLLKMEKSLPDIEERENVLKREFSKERESLQQTIDITTALVEETRKQSESHQHEMTLLKSENILVESLRESMIVIERERDNLNTEIRSLKSSPMTHSSSTEDSGVGGDDELRGQVDFLNSVIVDQQNKIGELNEKISELESMLLNGGDVDPMQVADEYERDAGDNQSRAAPRLFCDICDIFDAHDTDDCPTQSSMHYDTADLPPSTHNVTKPGVKRAYCDNCEMFGHQTEECTEEDEMY